MKLASHNSLTFSRVRQWWLKPFAWMARCQGKDLYGQWLAGVRYFDFRIRFDEFGLPVPAHGLAEYNGSPTESCVRLQRFSEKAREKVFIRLTLECTSHRNAACQERMFSLYCRSVEHLFRGSEFVVLCGGKTKLDWHTVYDFGTEQPYCIECYSSMPSQKNPLWKVWPWLFAKFHNRKAVERHKAEVREEILMLDYV